MKLGDAWTELQSMTESDLLGLDEIEAKSAEVAMRSILEMEDLADKLGLDGADVIAFCMAPTEILLTRSRKMRKLIPDEAELIEKNNLHKCFQTAVMLGVMYEKMRVREFANVFSSDTVDHPLEDK
jgi:hypothetical protein